MPWKVKRKLGSSIPEQSLEDKKLSFASVALAIRFNRKVLVAKDYETEYGFLKNSSPVVPIIIDFPKMDASWHFEVVYFSSFQVPHSKKIFIKRSYPVISSTEFVLLELVLPQRTNRRLALPSALDHKQTTMQRLTVLCFPFDSWFRHFNSQCREYHPDSCPLLAKRT